MGVRTYRLCSVLQASLRSSTVLATLPEYVLSFHPPLTIHNSIPYEITVMLSEGGTTSGTSRPGTFSVTIPAGGSVELQQYDLSQKIFMSMQLQVRHAHSPQAILSILSILCAILSSLASVRGMLVASSQALLPGPICKGATEVASNSRLSGLRAG